LIPLWGSLKIKEGSCKFATPSTPPLRPLLERDNKEGRGVPTALCHKLTTP